MQGIYYALATRQHGNIVKSSRYGWITYNVPSIDITVEYHDLNYKNGEELFEIYSSNFLVSAKRILNDYNAHYLGSTAYISILRYHENVYWNKRIIKETRNKRSKYRTYIEYVGPISAINEVVTYFALAI